MKKKLNKRDIHLETTDFIVHQIDIIREILIKSLEEQEQNLFHRYEEMVKEVHNREILEGQGGKSE